MDAAVKRMIVPAVVTLISFFALLAVRAVVFKVLHRWAEKKETRIDDIIIGIFKTPSIYWCFAIGLYGGVAVSDLHERYVFYFSKTIHVIVIFSITVVLANLSVKLFRDYVRRSDLPIPATGLAYGIVKGTILIIGILIILSVLGISITPLITALGVGGLAVALSLKDTLANLFAGIHILVEKTIRVGDFIRLETGQEGYVEDITWRTTRIKMLPNNTVVIPNNRIAQSIVMNYFLPEKRMALQIPVPVSYGSDIEKVERVLIEVARRAVGEVPGLLGEPEPSVSFHPGFGESSLDFTLNCQVAEFADQYPVQHQLRKRILINFRKEGIEIPFPTRRVYLRKEDTEGLRPAEKMK